ncbi:MAG: hypothetical protein HFK00_08080 [Oscillospiraceae bacterium]|nr:hypothetical protein [Oscillospiraceae bacterium]
MKFKSTNIINSKEILYNDHYVAIPYDCSALTADSSGIIKAGTVVPANDSTAIGILLYDVKKEDNPNGTVVIHGFIKSGALPEELSSEADLKQITFI